MHATVHQGDANGILAVTVESFDNDRWEKARDSSNGAPGNRANGFDACQQIAFGQVGQNAKMEKGSPQATAGKRQSQFVGRHFVSPSTELSFLIVSMVCARKQIAGS